MTNASLLKRLNWTTFEVLVLAAYFVARQAMRDSRCHHFARLFGKFEITLLLRLKRLLNVEVADASVMLSRDAADNFEMFNWRAFSCMRAAHVGSGFGILPLVTAIAESTERA